MSLPIKQTMLPPIDEQEEKEGEDRHFQSISYVNERRVVDEQEKTSAVVFANQVYVIELVSIKGKGSYRLKTYKEGGHEILKRQLKAKQIGVEHLWIEYKYNQNCLIANLSLNLNDLIFKAKKVDA